MLRHNKRCASKISEADLIKIDEALMKFHHKFSLLIAPLMPSKGDTIKYHKLSHITAQIRRLGLLKHMDGNFFEADHIR